MAYNYINKTGLQYIWNKIKAKFVAKDGDKVLSDNNFTDALKTKLDGIATGANKTTVDTALSSTSTNPVQNKVINSALGGKLSTSGTAAAATKLATARTVQTNLGSATAASFDGTGNITPGITGTLTVAHGGTGATSAADARTNLGITAANIGALPSGGTAASANKLATGRTIRTNLGSTSTATFDGTANVTPGVTGTLPIANGGTGATTAANARSNLGITPANIGALATSGGTVTGETIFQKGMYVHSATGTSGTTGFVNIAQFSLSGTTYQNIPLELTVYRRGTTAPTYLFIEFSSANNADPGLASFKYSGYGDSTSFYMYKSATSTWQLYIKKTESYDNIGIGSYTTNFAYMNVVVTWKNVQASSAPSGSTAATYMSVGSASTATTATKLATARTIRTNLASTSTASFDGSANVTPGVTGTLPIANGGTGMTSNPSLQVNLASGSAASVFTSSPRPGVTGILPVSHGGTGVSSEGAFGDLVSSFTGSYPDICIYYLAGSKEDIFYKNGIENISNASSPTRTTSQFSEPGVYSVSLNLNAEPSDNSGMLLYSVAFPGSETLQTFSLSNFRVVVTEANQKITLAVSSDNSISYNKSIVSIEKIGNIGSVYDNYATLYQKGDASDGSFELLEVRGSSIEVEGAVETRYERAYPYAKVTFKTDGIYEFCLTDTAYIKCLSTNISYANLNGSALGNYIVAKIKSGTEIYITPRYNSSTNSYIACIGRLA